MVKHQFDIIIWLGWDVQQVTCCASCTSANTELWQRGLLHRPAKAAYLFWYRWFKSNQLRHYVLTLAKVS